jgi:hypothetical protein
MKNVELEPEEVAVIAAARDSFGPTEIQRARVRRGLDARIAAGVAAPLLVTSTALATVLKVGAGVAVVVAVGTGVAVVAAPHWLHKPSLNSAAPQSRVTVVPVAPAALAPAAATASEPTAVMKTHTAAPHARTPPRRHEAAPSAPADLAGELDLLTQISAATKQGDVVRADALLRSYDQRYPAGQLAQERAAAGILLDCAAGRAQAARAAARRFIEIWPRSPLIARIQGSCAAGDLVP